MVKPARSHAAPATGVVDDQRPSERRADRVTGAIARRAGLEPRAARAGPTTAYPLVNARPSGLKGGHCFRPPSRWPVSTTCPVVAWIGDDNGSVHMASRARSYRHTSLSHPTKTRAGQNHRDA